MRTKISLLGLSLGLLLSIQAQSSNQRDGGSQILSPPYIQQQRELRYKDFNSKLITENTFKIGEESFQQKLAIIFFNLGLRYEKGEISDPTILNVLEKIFPAGQPENNVMAYLRQLRFATPEIVFDPQDIPTKDGISYCYFDGNHYEEVSSIKEDWNSPICVSIHLATVDYWRTDEEWLAIMVNDVVEKFPGVNDQNGSEALQEYVLLNIQGLSEINFSRKFIQRSIRADKKEFDSEINSLCTENLKLKIEFIDFKPSRKWKFPYTVSWNLPIYRASLDHYYDWSRIEKPMKKLEVQAVGETIYFEIETGNELFLQIHDPIIERGPSSGRVNYELSHCGKIIYSLENVKIENPVWDDEGLYRMKIHLGNKSLYSYGDNIFIGSSITKYFDFTNWLVDTMQ